MSKKQTSAAPKKGFGEFIRKTLVSLKRSPQVFAMLALLAAFLIYSLNLSSVSLTTAKINSANMGQCEFAAMLFSILALVCFLRSFPKRQKVNKPMLILLFAMLVVIVFVDVVYLSRISQAWNGDLVVNTDTAYTAIAYNAIIGHIVCIGICAVLLATLPVYGKLIKKINTSIDVEGNGEMEAIDISGED